MWDAYTLKLKISLYWSLLGRPSLPIANRILYLLHWPVLWFAIQNIHLEEDKWLMIEIVTKWQKIVFKTKTTKEQQNLTKWNTWFLITCCSLVQFIPIQLLQVFFGDFFRFWSVFSCLRKFDFKPGYYSMVYIGNICKTR